MTNDSPSASANSNRDISSSPEVLRAGGLRQLVESLVCLTVAVVVFRAFQMEGYMISTGSMAPCLLGYHQRIVCPTCRFSFDVGTAYDESVDAATVVGSDAATGSTDESATCPHCGQTGIAIGDVPVNQGDQLLVHKLAYAARTPRRWEVAVFRNPYEPTQAYVKRVVGLPGESIQVIDGDLFVDGRIQRKDFKTQRTARMLVFDDQYRPRHDAHWRSRWVPLQEGGWQRSERGFRLRDASNGAGESYGVGYRHWIRSGGTHQTSVPLPSSDRPLRLSSEAFLHVQLDPQAHRISCRGVLSEEWRDRLLAACGDAAQSAAIRRLHAASHVGPITDESAYNERAGNVPVTAVRDLMTSLDLTVHGGAGRFELAMTDGRAWYRLVLDFGRQQADLFVGDDRTPVRTNRRTDLTTGRPLRIEMSLFDRQVLVALDGEVLFEPLPLSAPAEPEEAVELRRPVRFEGGGLDADVTGLRLYRDVHYTRGKARNGVVRPYRLGPDQYFVLGDNSPVSSDSRNWPDGAVAEHLLVGRPLVVHLPSLPGEIRIGRFRLPIRIPDVRRIRYIR